MPVSAIMKAREAVGCVTTVRGASLSPCQPAVFRPVVPLRGGGGGEPCPRLLTCSSARRRRL